MATDRSGTARLLSVLARMIAAALTIAMGTIHLVLWFDGYHDIPLIGVLFLLNSIGAGLLALALLAAPDRVLALVAVLGAVFTAGTLGALVLSLTTGLLGYREIPGIPIINITLAVESAGALVLAALAAVHPPAKSTGGTTSRRKRRVRRGSGR